MFPQANSTSWKWFDDRNGKWCAYNSTSNSAIDTAYKNGESSIRFTAGRRKYLIQFNAMLQVLCCLTYSALGVLVQRASNSSIVVLASKEL